MVFFLILLIAESILLWQGQRQLFFLTVDATGSHILAYLLAAPGTVLHEASHYIVCLLLGVPAGRRVGGRVKFFSPERHEDGSITLGSVPHVATDPFRGALIAVAPILLVPPFLVGISALLLGEGVLSDPLLALSQAAWWKIAIWFYIALSCGQAAFPSPGDHIGIIGGFMLLLLLAAVVSLLNASGDLFGFVKFLALILAPSAAGSLIAFLIFRPLALRRRASK